ncbi:MAG: ABC transporter permease [Anaerolineales bacterium]|nr:MAG: ABC transporter permease [Anaerolineales bacterium]
MILRNLWRRKARSLLTMLGIGIGVAAVIALGAMAEGIAEGYAAFAGGSGADLLVTRSDAGDLTLSTVDEQVGERIRQLADVRNVSGVIFNMVSLESIPYFIIGGYDPEAVAIQHFKIIEGQPLAREREIILGRQAADNLKLSVDDTIKLYETSFRIVGIYETGQSFEDGGAIISLADAQAIFKKPRQVTFFEIQVRDPTQLDGVQARIEQLYDDLSVSKASDVGDEQVMVESMRYMAWGIGLIAVLIGGLGMMITMVMSVFEQTREIGVLRAVGWRKGRVLRLIMSQSLVLSALGGVLGVGIGFGLVWLINHTPAVSSFAPGVVRTPLLIQGMSVALVLGTVAGLYPAWRAAGLNPIEALRYDGGTGDRDESSWAQAFGMTFRNLLRRRARSLMTMGGIAIGVGLIVSLGAITEGVIQGFTDMTSQGGAELIAKQANVADMGYSVIEERIGYAIAAMPEVQDVSGIVWGFSMGKDAPFLFVFGMDPNGRAIQHFRTVEGERIRGRGEIMLGRAAADTLEKKVGDVIRLPGGVFRVTGIYETGVGYEEGGGVMALHDAQIAFEKPRQVSILQIKVRDPTQVEAVRARIEERYGGDVSVATTATFIEKSADIQNTKAMLGAVFVLAILVGGVVVTNTMVMAVMERTREIGTLRALGWRQSRVLWMILAESLLLSLIAAGLGILVGMGLTGGLQAIPGVGSFMSAVYTPQVIAQAIAVSLFLGAAGGLYPAWHASRLRPVEALRYE